MGAGVGGENGLRQIPEIVGRTTIGLFRYLLVPVCFLIEYSVFFLSNSIFLDSSTQNLAESFDNYINKLVLEPASAKFNQNSDFAHVRTYS